MKGDLEKGPTGGTFVDIACARGKQGERGSCSVEGYRTCAHTLLGRIQCSLGPKS